MFLPSSFISGSGGGGGDADVAVVKISRYAERRGEQEPTLADPELTKSDSLLVVADAYECYDEGGRPCGVVTELEDPERPNWRTAVI